MALSFVNGKPVKAKQIQQPQSLEEAMTPPTNVGHPEVLAAQQALNEMFHKTDDDGGPVLPIKIKIKVEAVGHVQNPPVVDVDISKTVAPQPSWPLDQFHVPVATGAGLDELAAVDVVKLSEQQEPESAVTEELAQTEVLGMVDEYTALQQQIDAADVTQLIAQQEVLKKRLAAAAKSSNYKATKPVRLMGTHSNYVEFSAQSNSTKITDKDGLVQAMGTDVYIANTEITLTAAKKVLPENVLNKYTTNTPGSRSLKTVHVGDEK